MKVRAFNIKYDTDGAKVKLPKSIIIDMDVEDPSEIDLEIADYISDITGWCVLDCCFEVIG